MKTLLEAEYEAILNAERDAITIVAVDEASRTFHYKRFSRACEFPAGMDAVRAVGRGPRQVLGDTLGADMEKRYRQCVDTRAAISFEDQRVESGTRRACRVTLTPLLERGAVVEIVVVSTNITEMRRQREALQEANDTRPPAPVSG
jgi:PAS domain S-box-containing protein